MYVVYAFWRGNAFMWAYLPKSGLNLVEAVIPMGYEEGLHLASSFDYFNCLRKEMLTFIPSNCKKLLDVGCGAGNFGGLIKKTLGAEVWGIDPSTTVTGLTNKVLDHFINDFFSEKLDLPSKYFDVVTFNDSLEHFSDPFPPLELSRRLLKPGGVLVCSIPNVRYIENLKHLFFEMDWKYEDSGIRDRTHLRFFTKKSIVRTLEEAGYQVLLIQGINRRHWWWEGRRFIPIRFFLGKWIIDMNYLQFAVVATPKYL
jgi:ubiquinone/menaquinone biosynthesis C-methylase UbiE